MTRLEYLSQFSNAVLTPELNCKLPLLGSKGSWAKNLELSGKNISEEDLKFRKHWCKQQLRELSEFGAVFGDRNC